MSSARLQKARLDTSILEESLRQAARILKADARPACFGELRCPLDLLLEVFALLGKVLGATCLQPGDAGLYPQTEYQCWCGAGGGDFDDSAETTRPCAKCGAVMHLTCAEYVRGRALATNDVNATFDMSLCKICPPPLSDDALVGGDTQTPVTV